MTITHTPDLFEAAEAAEAARLARFDLAFKLQDNVKATLLDPENLRLDSLAQDATNYAAFALTSDIAEAMMGMVAPERRGPDLRERLTEVVQEAVEEAKLAELIEEQIEQSMRINAFGPLEEIASRIAREIAQQTAKGETLPPPSYGGGWRITTGSATNSERRDTATRCARGSPRGVGPRPLWRGFTAGASRPAKSGVRAVGACSGGFRGDGVGCAAGGGFTPVNWGFVVPPVA